MGWLIPKSGKVAQFGVDKPFRGLGIGKWIFSGMAKIAKAKLTIQNIDQSDLETVQFLEGIGLKPYINQYEMELTLNSGYMNSASALKAVNSAELN